MSNQRSRRARPFVPVMRDAPAAQDTAPVELLIRNKWAYPVNPMAVGMDWGRRGYSCERIADPPDKEWRDFAHEANEVVVVLNGRLEIEIEHGGAVELIDAMAGDEVFVPTGARHTVRNVHPGVTRWLFGYQRPNLGF